VTKPLAVALHVPASHKKEFGSQKPHHPGCDAENDYQHAKDADSETGMVKVTHRGFSLSRARQKILTIAPRNCCKESDTNRDKEGGLTRPRMGIRVRAARAGDAHDIGKLARHFAQYLSDLGDPIELKLTAEAYLRDGFGLQPAFSGLVAEEGDTVIGYLLYHFGYDSDNAVRNLHIVDLYVQAEARKKRVGTALMEAAAEIAVKAGAEELVWSVYNLNSLAASFYEKLGAERITEVFFMRLRADALKSGAV